MRRCLFLSLVITFCIGYLPHSPTVAQTETANKRGLHLLLDDGRHNWPVEQWPDHLRHASDIVGTGGFVVQLVSSDDLDVAKWNQFMALCAAHNLQPILRLATTFDRANGWWVVPSADENGRYHGVGYDYAVFLAQLHWPSVPRIVIGNEPNHGTEWGGQPDPAAYAAFLRDVALAVHRALPHAVVMNAPVDHYAPHTGSTPFTTGIYCMAGERFLDEMIAADPTIFSVIDAWASHPYPMGAFIAPPWEQTFAVDYLNGASNPTRLIPPDDIANRGINGYEFELLKLASYGIPQLPVYITETGWRHNAYDPATYPDYPDPDTAAQFVDLAMWGNHGRYPNYPETGWTAWADDPRVVAVVFFALNGHPAEWTHTNWLSVDASGEVLRVLPLAAAIQP